MAALGGYVEEAAIRNCFLKQSYLIPAPHNRAVVVVQLGALNNIDMMRLGW